MLNKVVNLTSSHQDVISVIFPLIWPEIVEHRGLTVKGEQEFQRRLTLYTAVVNLRIVHQGRVTFKKFLNYYFHFTTPTLTQATHQTDDNSSQSATVNKEGVPVTGIIDTRYHYHYSGDMFKTASNC